MISPRVSRRDPNKGELRSRVKRKIDALGRGRLKRKSALIFKKLLRQGEIKTAVRIACYLSFGTEVSTREFIKAALNAGKEIYVPRINKRTGRMEIYSLRSLRNALIPGAFGILEPRAIHSRKGRIQDMDLIVVPGMAFTKKGARLGRGGGHFDRLLARARGIRKIGLAYREQILPKIPMERHDIFMDRVITD